MTQNDRDELTNKGHLYRGLSDPPSAHSDPPASVVGPTGLRQDPDAVNVAGVDPAGTPQQTVRGSRPAREELSYDTIRPRTRGGSGAKLLLGAGAALGAAIVFLILKSGIFGAGGGHGGTSPGVGGAAPNPPTVAQSTQPTTAPAASPTTSDTLTAVPIAPLHLTIVNETYRVGAADGKEVSLEEAISLAKSVKPAPVTIDLIDSSRQGVKEDLRSALEQQHIPIIWTRDGKSVGGEVSGPGKAPTPEEPGSK